MRCCEVLVKEMSKFPMLMSVHAVKCPCTHLPGRKACKVSIRLTAKIFANVSNSCFFLFCDRAGKWYRKIRCLHKFLPKYPKNGISRCRNSTHDFVGYLCMQCVKSSSFISIAFEILSWNVLRASSSAPIDLELGRHGQLLIFLTILWVKSSLETSLSNFTTHWACGWRFLEGGSDEWHPCRVPAPLGLTRCAPKQRGHTAAWVAWLYSSRGLAEVISTVVASKHFYMHDC